MAVGRVVIEKLESEVELHRVQEVLGNQNEFDSAAPALLSG